MAEERTAENGECRDSGVEVHICLAIGESTSVKLNYIIVTSAALA